MANAVGLLPAVGTLSYNGYTFNAGTKLAVAARFKWDDAERTIVGTEYTFHVETYIGNSTAAGQESDMAALRILLSKPAAPLVFASKGFGDLTVNPASMSNYAVKRDISWGPKPRFLEWTAVGNVAARVVYEVTVTVPECNNATYLLNPGSTGRLGSTTLMAFNYEVEFDVDQDGYTTRTITGYLEIPMSRDPQNPRQVFGTADQFRDRITIPFVPGFRRTVPGRFKESADRRRLTFVFVDVEIPTGGGLPKFCTGATGRHKVKNANSMSTYLWRGTITATYTPRAGAAKAVAWQAFFALMTDRIKAARTAAQAAGQNAQGVILYDFGFDEELYLGRSTSFEVSYVFPAKLKDLFLAAGTWRPAPDSDWQTWNDSVSDVLGVRGNADLKSKPAQDTIVDLCGAGTRNLSESTQPEAEVSTAVTPRMSGGYLYYRNFLDIVENHGIAYLQQIPTPAAPPPKAKHIFKLEGAAGTIDPNTLPSISATSDPNQDLQNDIWAALGRSAAGRAAAEQAGTPVPPQFIPPNQLPAPPAVPPPVEGVQVAGGQQGTQTTPPAPAQKRHDATYTVRLHGFGYRAGGPVPIPKLTKLAGAVCLPFGAPVVRTAIVGRIGDQPIHYAKWTREYKCTLPPNQGIIGAPFTPSEFDFNQSAYV